VKLLDLLVARAVGVDRVDDLLDARLALLVVQPAD
jgi:hypothetical protein